MHMEKDIAPQERNERELKDEALDNVTGGMRKGCFEVNCIECGRGLALTAELYATYGRNVLCRRCEVKRLGQKKEERDDR